MRTLVKLIFSIRSFFFYVLISECSFVFGQDSDMRVGIFPVAEKDLEIEVLVFVAKLKGLEIWSSSIRIRPLPDCGFAELVDSLKATNRATPNQNFRQLIVRS